MKHLFLTALAGIVLASTSCKKDDADPVPPAPSGQNIMTFNIAGSWRQYKDQSTWNHPEGVSYNWSTTKVGIVGSSDAFKDEVALILPVPLDSLHADTTYRLGGETNTNIGEYTTFSNNIPTSTTYSTADGSGWVRFSRLDKFVAAGTFALTAYRDGQKGGDSVVITAGRFDIAY